MQAIAVIYQSRYGATARYAQWIAKELQAELLRASAVEPARLRDYDLVIYGGGIYPTGIHGIKLVTRHPVKRLVVFTVGISDPATADYTELLGRSFTPEQQKTTRVFHLRGAIDYQKLGFIHKKAMAMLKKWMLDKKPEAERTQEERDLLATYGGQADYTDRESIRPLVDYVRAQVR